MLIKITAGILLVWSVALTVAFFQVNKMMNATRVQSNQAGAVLTNVVLYGMCNKDAACLQKFISESINPTQQ